MIIVDTNALVSFFLDRQPQARVVKKVIESPEKIHIPDLCLIELEYVTLKTYGHGKRTFVKMLQSLVDQSNIIFDQITQMAIDIYKNNNISLADCLLVSEAILSDSDLLTFDKTMLKIYKEIKYTR